jgi:hypothetical protein
LRLAALGLLCLFAANHLSAQGHGRPVLLKKAILWLSGEHQTFHEESGGGKTTRLAVI